MDTQAGRHPVSDNPSLTVGVLTLLLHIPGSLSLKEKRGRIKPLIARIHREFNVSAAEVDHHDAWQDAVIACSAVSNDATHTRQVLQQVLRWVETNWMDVEVTSEAIEIR